MTFYSAASHPAVETHALVIGVGTYHHMTGGVGPINNAFDLPQLTSPPHSAIAFAEWLLHNLKNPVAPLGSLELLTSPPRACRLPDGQPKDSVDATMQNVVDAFTMWYDRLKSRPDNVGLFYFCGHGLMRQDLHLLPSDFGRSSINPFDTSVNFARTYAGMGQCPARTQCYFLDCCQQTAFAMSQQIDDPGRVLIPPQFRKPHTGDAPKFLATAPSGSAYGMTNEITLFTKDLLDCLSRRGSRRRPGGKWVVTTAALSEALGGIRASGPDQSSVQVYRTDGYLIGTSTLHELDIPPEVDVHLGCNPEAANDLATFDMKVSIPPHHPTYRRTALPGIWKFRASANHYIWSANFADAEYPAAQREVWVIPPGPTSEIIELDT